MRTSGRLRGSLLGSDRRTDGGALTIGEGAAAANDEDDDIFDTSPRVVPRGGPPQPLLVRKTHHLVCPPSADCPLQRVSATNNALGPE